MKVHLDTHAVVWLYTGEVKKFSKTLFGKMQSADLFISPPVMLELAMLHQIGKSRDSEDKVFNSLHKEIKLEIDNVDCAKAFLKSCNLTWTRDPFDRLIVACAEVSGVTLVTRDLHIHNNFKRALW
ncbi:MAG: PIN domain-containing protein [Bdellovibrio sp.]|nr:PIN domain-containing protein [Bdellovibrio sp.]